MIVAAKVHQPKSKRVLLWATVAAMVLGVSVGWLLNISDLSPALKTTTLEGLGVVTAVFLRLIRMIVAPLIFSTLVVGIAQAGSAGSVGKVGLRALVWFLTASLVAITTGLVLANLLTPGEGMNLQVASNVASNVQPGASLNIPKMIEEFVPTSIIDAMAKNSVLQIVVFAVFAGIAIGQLGQRAEIVRIFAEQIQAIMMRIAGFIMATAPLAVFSALASTTLEHGIAKIALLGQFVGMFYCGLAVMVCFITLAGAWFLKNRIGSLIKGMREPLLIAFSTASSEASYPAAYTALQEFGVSRRVAGLVLPLGYAFNLDGSLVYSSFSVMFIAQAYGIDLGLPTQIGIMLFLLLANKGAAGVPRGGLVNLTIALAMFDLPVEGVALILGIDALLDMGRTTINVYGNAVATASIAKIEGDLLPSEHANAFGGGRENATHSSVEVAVTDHVRSA